MVDGDGEPEEWMEENGIAVAVLSLLYEQFNLGIAANVMEGVDPTSVMVSACATMF